MVNSSLLHRLFEKLRAEHVLVVFAESLTGGLISSEFSKIAGVSAVLWGSFVVYNTHAKLDILHVPETIIETYGVVSKECAIEMAKGALKISYTKKKASPSYSLAVTGLAGPATKDDILKVGTVCIAVAKINEDFPKNLLYLSDDYISSFSEVFHFEGDRNNIREQTLNKGVELLIRILK